LKTLYTKIKYRILVYPIFLILKFFSKRVTQLNNPHFFVLGSGRNGSTLLATILNAHPNFIVPPEQYILPYAIMRRYVFFFWSSKSWINNIVSLFNNDNKNRNWNLNLDNLNTKTKDIPKLFSEIFNRYKDENKSTAIYWGDKTPLNTHFMRFIFPEFKSAKYIFLIRDPRDVMSSYKKYKGKNFDYRSYSIWKWQDSIKTLDYLKLRTNLLIVRYEDLVEKTNSEMNKIQSFLEVDIIENLANIKMDISNMRVENMAHHQNLRSPISNRSVGKWKNDLSELDLNVFDDKIKSKMKRFGYL